MPDSLGCRGLAEAEGRHTVTEHEWGKQCLEIKNIKQNVGTANINCVMKTIYIYILIWAYIYI